MLRVSVITPSYNQGQFLASALESVFTQIDDQVEHLVVDSQSTDETAAVLSLHADRVQVIDKSSRNAASAFNRGLRQATGDVIGWLNADDTYCPGAITVARQLFAQHPDVDVVYGGYHLINEKGERRRTRVPRTWPNDGKLRDCLLLPPAVFFRRQILSQWGDLDENLEYWEDLELLLRLTRYGAQFQRTGKVLASRRSRVDGRRWDNPCLSSCADVAKEFNEVTKRHVRSVSIRHCLRQSQAETEAAGHTRYDSPEWDKAIIRRAVALHQQYNSSGEDKAWLRTKVVAGHIRKELQCCLQRPRQTSRFLPRSGRRFVRKYLSRKIFTTRFLDPQPVRLPAHYSNPKPMVEPPMISIVTPSLNQGEFLEATLHSVLDQAYPRLEYVVQDGGSTDDSVDVIRSFDSQLAAWESAPDEGQADAINRGMRHTSGEIMAYLNSDDLLLPGSLAYVADYFREHPEVDVIYGHRILIDQSGDEIGRWILPPHDNNVITWADFIPQETMFWRRRAWQKVGSQLDPSFSFALDWDLILRFRQAGLRFARLPRFLGAFRITPEQKTSQLIKTIGAREMDRLRFRIHGHYPTARKIRRVVRFYMWRHWMYDTLYSAGLAKY